AVKFTIDESITFAPLVNFGGVRGNIWYQFGFTDINWLGRGMQLTTFYQNIDRRHNFSIYYRLPYWRGSRWGTAVSILRFASTEPLFFDEGTVYYDYENLSFGGTGIYELSRHHFIELGGTYFVERYRKTEDQDLEVTPGPDQLTQPKFLFKFIHQIRRINYDYYFLDGFAWMTNIQTVYNFEENDWFHILLSDLTYFRRLSFNGNLAFRLRVGISTNTSTPFAPFVLDSHVNIRGSGNRIDRGTATLILNTEYRQRFFDYRNFAGQVVVFSDLGTWRNPGGSFEDLVTEENLRHFVGLGFRIIYKKAFNAIFRLDYGVDIRNTSERGLVLGIGQYF
ncbi:MAG: outer membrane protein assembly factor, partial [Bacteroidota bacterium]